MVRSGVFPSADSQRLSLLVADFENHRIMRWAPGATQGTVVAGGHGRGTPLSAGGRLQPHSGLLFAGVLASTEEEDNEDWGSQNGMVTDPAVTSKSQETSPHGLGTLEAPVARDILGERPKSQNRALTPNPG